MNYAFKMMAVVSLSFSMSGCVEMMVAEALIHTANAVNDSINSSSSSYSNNYKTNKKNWKFVIGTDDYICNMATPSIYLRIWNKQKHLQVYVNEAKHRGLDCGVGDSNKKNNGNNLNYKYKERFINADNNTVCKYFNDEEWISEAKRRGLDCGVNDNVREYGIVSVENKKRTILNQIAKETQDSKKKLEIISNQSFASSNRNTNNYSLSKNATADQLKSNN